MFGLSGFCAMPPQQIRMSGSSRFRLVAMQLGRRLIERRRRPVAAGGEGRLGCCWSHRQCCHCGCAAATAPPAARGRGPCDGGCPSLFHAAASTRRPGLREYSQLANARAWTRFGRGNPAVAGRVIVRSETAPLGRSTLLSVRVFLPTSRSPSSYLVTRAPRVAHQKPDNR